MMKKTLFALLALASAGSALAASTNPFAPAATAPEVSPYSYELGVTTHRETYQEFVDGNKLMQEVGLMTGIKGSVARDVTGTGGKVVLTGEYALGATDYTGSYMGGAYGDVRASNLSRSLFEATGMYKHTSPTWNGVTAGVGLGYRHLVDNLQDAGPGGYKRTNDRLYVALSLEKAIEFKNWTVTPGVQYKHLLVSKQKSDLYGGVTVRQNHGYGAEASVSFTHKDDGYRPVFTPYIRMWNINDSKVDGRTGLYEPHNKTKEIGFSVSVQF